MIFDITMVGNCFFITVHKKFFEYEFFKEFVTSEGIAKEHAAYGEFSYTAPFFGFDCCMKQIMEDSEYFYFSVDFPVRATEKQLFGKKENLLCVAEYGRQEFRKFLLTVHNMNHLILESMHFEKFLFDTHAWDDQSLSFVMIFRGGRSGYSIGGFMYEWAKEKIASLCMQKVKELEDYVHRELSRFFSYYNGEEIKWEQVTFSNTGWFIQPTSGGRWASWVASRNGKNDFSSHNIDHSNDQAVLFAGIVAMNTFLRNN